MGFFKKLFGRESPDPEKSSVPQKATPPALPPHKEPVAQSDPVNPDKDKDLIRLFDAYGREMQITKEVWQTRVLPGTIKSSWNNPDQLSGLIVGAMKDGLREMVIDAAEQLYRIDPQPARAACIWGRLLLEGGRLDEAERVFRDHIARHGENGSVLTNLAKVYSRRKNEAKAEEILWHGLEVDPNQDNGLVWYFAIHRERGGEVAGQEALRRIAALPGSWRARLWLARQALQERRLEDALALYEASLDAAAKPIPADLLMQMSGDLGNFAHLPELLRLTAPYFEAKPHGLSVGNNLIKAYLDLGQPEAARRIIDELYALKRLDWQKTLGYWDNEMAKTRLQTSAEPEKTPLKITMAIIEGPVWLKPSSPASELFDAKPANGPTICFLGSTADMANPAKQTEQQMADAPGRLSRALPLFLAEHIDFHTDCRVQALFPFVLSPPGGFVFSGVRWNDADAAQHARQTEHKNDYVVISHLNTVGETWTADLRLVRTIDGQLLGESKVNFPAADFRDEFLTLARQLVTLLAEQTGAEPNPPPADYEVPAGVLLPNYLLRLEQLLAVRCTGMDGIVGSFLNGERAIIAGNLQLCLDNPRNVGIRILLAQTLSSMKRVRPDILPEFGEKVELLQKQMPLYEPVQSVVQRIINEALAPSATPPESE